MSGFNLSSNFKQQSRGTPKEEKDSCRFFLYHATDSRTNPPAPSISTTMARSLHDYSTAAVANVPVEPAVNTGNGNFELRTGLLTMVQANQFYGLPSEDANAHLQNFLEL